jgi:hypothetical protein
MNLAVFMPLWLICVFILPVHADQEATVAYYQNQDGLVRLSLVDRTHEVVRSDLPEPLIFSPDGQLAAYRDGNEVWLGRVENLEFHRIADESMDVRPYGGLLWTPDSLFLIFSYADPTPIEQLPTQVRTFRYDYAASRLDEWNWGSCSSLVRHMTTRRIGLLCQPVPTYQEVLDSSVILMWGGDQENYLPTNYEILLNQLQFPGNFDWHEDSDLQQVIYINYVDFPVEDVFVAEGTEETYRLNLGEEDNIQGNIISVSPDRTMVAYVVECNYRQSRGCLQIADTATGDSVWHTQQTIRLGVVWRLAWSPDNRFIAMLGTDVIADAQLYVLDVEIGTFQSFHIGTATGNLLLTTE